MGLLADVYSYGDTMKRKVRGLLDDPRATLEQFVGQLGDDTNTNIRNMQQGYGFGGQKATDPAQVAAAQKALADYGAQAGMAGIVAPDVARGLNTVRNIPKDELFSSAVTNTPGAQLTEDGLLMRLQRGQDANQSNKASVRGGVFYLPEGAAQAKYYTTGKNGYGGTEKIAGETLLQNPLFVKGATGGKAPEAAIDQLLGKGTYQSIRTDALSTMGYGLPTSENVKRVSDFLGKYAPELQDQAAYIVQNSAKGNQLPYALQEAAVGSAVRNAGHDAVLGYSKGKTGPFLSEVFDVRESHYPDKFGGSKVWEGLLK